MTNTLFSSLRGGIIVSCQAEGDSPFNSPAGVLMFAQAAVQGGAAGIRSEGLEKTRYILENINRPVIGLIKSAFDNGFVRITGQWKDVEQLHTIGTTIIAIDGTLREREGLTGPEFIRQAKARFGCAVMADIATVEEGLACAEAGADCISTTLSGYTPETADNNSGAPDFAIVEKLVSVLHVPLFAEGRINTPEAAAGMLQRGAWAVVVGSAITRPALITKWYVDAAAGKQGK
jgi:N-acylglucosamine-6-phosphate 2-epimerase